MSRSQRLDPLLRVAEQREREAARRLGESRGRLEHQRRRLGELQGYRDEYGGRFDAACSGGIDMRQLHEYRAFLGRLDDALAHQAKVIAKAEAEVERHQQEWLALRTRLASLDSVRERLRRDECRQAERRDQRDLDERVSAAAARRRVDEER